MSHWQKDIPKNIGLLLLLGLGLPVAFVSCKGPSPPQRNNQSSAEKGDKNTNEEFQTDGRSSSSARKNSGSSTTSQRKRSNQSGEGGSTQGDGHSDACNGNRFAELIQEINPLNPMLTAGQFNDLVDKLQTSNIPKALYERYGLHEKALTYADSTRKGWQYDSRNAGRLNLPNQPGCLICHSGVVNGEVIIGAPNHHVNLADFFEDANLAGVSINNVTAAWDYLPSFFSGGSCLIEAAQFIADHNNHSQTRGLNTAFGYGVLLLDCRNDDLSFSKSHGIFNKRIHNIPLDTPPLWNVIHKKRLYYDGGSRGSAAHLAQSFLTPEVSGETLQRKILPRMDEVYEAIKCIAPPKFPEEIDDRLAQQGEKLFNKTCARCHGVYSKNMEYFYDDFSYPDYRSPISEIGTDPLRMRALTADFAEHLERSVLGEGKSVDTVELPKDPGYMAPPLWGVWASAPYLHNGSVPTIADLLSSQSQRPARWMKRSDSIDEKRLGIDITTKIPRGTGSRDFYDTSRRGLSHSGHEGIVFWGSKELAIDNKRAIIEYLKTL